VTIIHKWLQQYQVTASNANLQNLRPPTNWPSSLDDKMNQLQVFTSRISESAQTAAKLA
jgi:hypothetical protein